MALSWTDYPQLDWISVYGNAFQIFFQTSYPLAFIFFFHDQNKSGAALGHSGVMDNLPDASYYPLPILGYFELDNVCTREAIHPGPVLKVMLHFSIVPRAPFLDMVIFRASFQSIRGEDEE